MATKVHTVATVDLTALAEFCEEMAVSAEARAAGGRTEASQSFFAGDAGAWRAMLDLLTRQSPAFVISTQDVER